MTLEELKTRCEYQLKIAYAYGVFKEPIEPPYLVGIMRASDNFMADNKVYIKDKPMQLDLVYKEKNLNLENEIENILLGDIPWNKTDEAYLEDEDVFIVSYFFEIEDDNNSYPSL